MSNLYPLSLSSDYEVMISSPLQEYEQKLLLRLYMPIIGSKAVSLYQYFYSIIEAKKYESNIETHDKIVKTLHLRSIDKLLEARKALEAVNLIDTYYKDGLYVYVVKKPLDAISFFEDTMLASIYKYQVGLDEYSNTYYELTMRKLDLNKFKCITSNFDDVFDIEPSDDILIANANYYNINNGIVVTNKDFDFNQFIVLLSAHDVIKPEYFSNEEFINVIKRYSFLYNLNPDEMKQVVIKSVDEYKNVSFDEIAINAKHAMDLKGVTLNVCKKSIVKKVSTTNDKLIKYLETASPSDFVKNKTGVALTSPEIEMFDRLLKETNITVGVLNVLIGFVLENLNGEIPSYNYFLKIVNTWLRAGVKSTKDAIEKVGTKKQPNSHSKVTKAKKDVPSWYDGYVNEVKKTNNKEENDQKSSEELEELKDFFTPTN